MRPIQTPTEKDTETNMETNKDADMEIDMPDIPRDRDMSDTVRQKHVILAYADAPPLPPDIPPQHV